MLIKRNVYFSAVDQETGEERLFSVNEIMTEEEYLEKMYSKANDKRLSNEDLDCLRFAKKDMKYHKNPKEAEEMREYYTTGKRTKYGLAKNSAKVGAAGALIGTSLKTALNMDPAIEKGMLKGTEAGIKRVFKGTPKAAAIGGAVGLAAGYGIQKAGQKHVKNKLKKDPKAFEKGRDAIDVATGEMSLSKFRKKYGKDYEKED